MDGYIASGRIVRARPRLARSGRPSADAAASAATLPLPGAVELTLPATRTDEADTAPTRARTSFVEHWRAIRERWSQLTFYLFDPESWR